MQEDEVERVSEARLKYGVLLPQKRIWIEEERVVPSPKLLLITQYRYGDGYQAS